MDGELFKICAIAVLCAVVGAVLGRAVGGMAVAIKLAGLALVLGGGIAILGEIVAEINALGVDGSVARYSALMLKGLGVAVLCRVCSDICRDCGEQTVASAVESAGKLSMLLLAMPLIGEMVEVASELLEKL